MKQQPYLTDFPRTIIANSARRFQARIRKLRQSMREQSLSGYAVMFDDVLPSGLLSKIDPTKRNRHFGCLPVFWAWFAQIIEGNASCSKAVAMIQSWCRAHDLPAPSADTSSYCKGRQRLCEAFLGKISERVDTHLVRHVQDDDLWNGMVLKAIDGSSVKLADTQANQAEYPQPSQQKPGCGFPVMAVSGLINLSHGGWEAIATASGKAHDLAVARPMLEQLGDRDLLLADRAYCSYAYIAEVRERGAHVLMRLHQKREGALNWAKGKRISPYERLVTWRRPQYPSAGQLYTREQWEALPETMEVRLIRLGYEDRTGKRRHMTVVTTLTDAKQHDGIELHALYARRWEIELRLRDIKTTLGFEMINAKTPEMAHKTLMMIRITYNLMRVLMQRAAHEAGSGTGSMSFKEAIDLCSSIHESFRSVANKPRKRKEHMRFFIEMLAARVVNQRPGRREPRALKIRPKPFQLLTAPRHEFIEIHHRSKYRASA